MESNFLKGFRIFSNLTEAEIEQVQAVAIERKYERGQYIFMQGQTREAVFFVQKGLVKVFKVDDEGREQIVNVLGAGQMFPHVGFFYDSPYPGTAEALTTCSLLSIRSTQFEELLLTNPEMTRKVLRVLGHRILQLQEKLQEVTSFDTRDRVIALLKHLAEEHGEPKADGTHIKLPLTNMEMARMIGVTRESVNRIINQLRKDGMLRGDRDEWVMNFP